MSMPSYLYFLGGETHQYPHALSLVNKHASRRDGGCAAFPDRLFEIRHAPRPAARDHRHLYGGAHCPDQGNIIPLPGPVTVDRVQEDFPCTRFLQGLRPGHRIPVRLFRTRHRIDLLLAQEALFYIDTCYNGLSAINISYFFQNWEILKKHAVENHFLEPAIEDLFSLVEGADAAAKRHRHERFTRYFRCLFEVRRSFRGGCPVVEQHQLVGFFLVEDLDGIDRVADIIVLPEPDGLIQAAVLQQ